MTRLCWIVLLFVSGACAQLRQIDVSKLPQDEHVRAVFSRLLPLESYAHEWVPEWEYEMPKEQVVSAFTSSLHDLRAAEAAAPGNAELAVLTGLVAHFAYNLDVQDAYEPAVHSLQNAHKLAPADYRTDWFLGIHRCQSNDVEGGMEQLLDVENRFPWRELPIAFWDDYIGCGIVSLLPAHTLRAIDHALSLGASPSAYTLWSDMSQKRYKPTDAERTYPANEVWAKKEEKPNVQFTSQLCGIRFSASDKWHVNVADATQGSCVATLETGHYPSHSGQIAPTLLVLTRAAKPGQTLSDFAQLVLNKRYALAKPLAAPSCPVEKCLAFDIVDTSVYKPDGGAHFLAVVFAGEPPEYPGLLFETPTAPPKEKSDGKIQYFTATEKLHRFPGTLYTLVMLDSNADIFEKASGDFRSLLKSVQLD
jgi:hypothetical protein